MDAENIVVTQQENTTAGGATGKLADATSTTVVWETLSATQGHLLRFFLKDLDTTGYNSMPAKPDLYDWKVVMTIRAGMFNDNGTGTQGDIIAAGTMGTDAGWRVWFRAASAETVGGTITASSEVEVRNLDALSAAGDETVYVMAELACPVKPLSTDASSSEYIHVDWAAGGVTTDGVAGLSLPIANFDISNVRLIGYPKERLANYTDVTYRDATGVHAISKDDEFIDYFGKLAIQYNDDPNFSVDALFRDKIGNSGHVLGAMVETLKSYSALKHKGSDTIDQKYIDLNVAGGISDLIGVRKYLDRTVAPFGEALASFVSDKDDITYLFATLHEDLLILAEGLEHDKDLAKQAVKMMPFSTSANVHF
jgi:hypothetical protein